ncbi:MAG: hypothetical protein QXS85_00680 [Acidilobaceae archaeon]
MDLRVTGLALVVAGFALAIIYSYLVLYSEHSEEVVKLTLAIAAILAGGFIAGTGLALILGWRRFSEAKRRIRERESAQAIA